MACSVHSPVQAIAILLLSINGSLIDKNQVSTLFCDLKEAFDTLNHTILLEKINNAGIRGKGLELLRSSCMVEKFIWM